ncbi:MAG: hypothetical protein M3N16_00440 [Actinomycetota bacterium]|nr:hypothetical protein [Actinomycetota bacterium]
MSIRHPELSALIEKLAAAKERPDAADLELLEDYAAPVDGIEAEEDQLGGVYVELVREFTGRDDVHTPRRAARALLATIDG